MVIQNNNQPAKQKPKKPTVTVQTNPSTVTPTNSNSNIRPIMIAKPTDTITFMRTINNNLKFTINWLRPIKCVIRGLPINTDPELIKTSLAEKNFNILNVFQLRKSDQERSPMPLFQIQLESTPEAENIWNLDSLLYTKIKRSITQQEPSVNAIAANFLAIPVLIAGYQLDA
ncbi:hypothetical protein CEXT_362761 [Caerostris extrusa]|uniref:Pre-C2HC domain-containing protein n=1 Tax=Caerostris extrusa TaxID=172846 RepID=A0AAV4PSY0_CAEEX|nr:hypothetical protein CEXT_362761 [Caerostris extrusa]